MLIMRINSNGHLIVVGNFKLTVYQNRIHKLSQVRTFDQMATCFFFVLSSVHIHFRLFVKQFSSILIYRYASDISNFENILSLFNFEKS